MKVGNVVQPNAKGQIVIPKKIRDLLHITDKSLLDVQMRGNVLTISPITEVITGDATENAYYQLLKHTQGAWGAVDEKEKDAEKARTEKELEATKRNKQAW